MAILELSKIPFELTEIGLRCVTLHGESASFLARLYLCKEGGQVYGLCHLPFKAQSAADGGNKLPPDEAIRRYRDGLTEIAVLLN